MTARTARREPPPMSQRAMGTTLRRSDDLRRRLFLDHLLPALQIEVPHRAVEVDRRLFHALEEVTDLHAELVPEERNEIVERIHGAVHAPADAVADRHRPEQREHQVGTGPRAPDPEGLAEVFLTGRELGHLAGVEETTEAERAVDHESGDFAQRTFPLP